jgi:hypothetical protein
MIWTTIIGKRHTEPASFVPADPCLPLDVSLIGWLGLAVLVSVLRCHPGYLNNGANE